MMRILADENFPRLAVKALRKRGHDVLWILEEFPGAPDEKLLALAQRNKRLLVTMDKDFGELAFHQRLPSACGVILFRFGLQSPQTAKDRIVRIFESRNDWAGCFTVVEENRLRMRPLPETKP